jgi:predicted anti-sigma-YlaC factor YlaD
MIDCDRAAALIERRLDGEASPQDDAALDIHVAGCPSCAELLEHETTLDAALAARFAGAMPSAGFTAAVRTRIAGEQPSTSVGWISDALNAAGLVFSVLVVLPIATWWGGAAGAAIGLGALLMGSYPLLLASWAAETGSGEPDPAP